MKKYSKRICQSAELLKVMGHPIRICILNCLMEQPSNVTKIQEYLKLPQSTASQHLSTLKNAGVIQGERKGLEVIYSIINNQAKEVLRMLVVNPDMDNVDSCFDRREVLL